MIKRYICCGCPLLSNELQTCAQVSADHILDVNANNMSGFGSPE